MTGGGDHWLPINRASCPPAYTISVAGWFGVISSDYNRLLFCSSPLSSRVLPLLSHLMYVCFTVNLPAVLAGASVAFLLLALLIAGIIAGLVLLRRMKRKRKSLEKKQKLVERIECTEKREELPGNESTAGNNSKQHVVDMHYESIDVLGQDCHGRVEGSEIRSKGGDYDVIDAANVLSKPGVGHGMKEKGQQDDQPKGTPNAVYAVVDKSKKMKQGKTQGGASATTTQGIYTEEQHYECSSVFGQDWVGNWVGEKPEGNHGDVEKGGPSNVAKKTGLQSEPCNPNAVYAVVDKSKKKNEGNKNGATSITPTDEVEEKGS